MSAITPSMLQLFGIGAGAASSVASGIAQWKAGTAQANAYEYNAKIAERRTVEEAEASRQKFAQLMARQRILYAKAGVDLASGSPLLVLMDTAYQGAEEMRRIRRSGAEEVALNRYYGSVASYQGKTGAMSTFLTGLGKAGTQYYEYQKGL